MNLVLNTAPTRYSRFFLAKVDMGGCHNESSYQSFEVSQKDIYDLPFMVSKMAHWICNFSLANIYF